MQTRSAYEEIILREMRSIPTETIPQVIKILKSVRQTILATRQHHQLNMSASGLCGAWRDDRNAEEIVDDLRSHRSGYGQRRIDL